MATLLLCKLQGLLSQVHSTVGTFIVTLFCAHFLKPLMPIQFEASHLRDREVPPLILAAGPCYEIIQLSINFTIGLLPSNLLSKTTHNHIFRTTIFPTVVYVCENRSLTLKQEHRLRVSENRVLREYLHL